MRTTTRKNQTKAVQLYEQPNYPIDQYSNYPVQPYEDEWVIEGDAVEIFNPQQYYRQPIEKEPITVLAVVRKIKHTMVISMLVAVAALFIGWKWLTEWALGLTILLMFAYMLMAGLYREVRREEE